MKLHVSIAKHEYVFKYIHSPIAVPFPHTLQSKQS